MHAARIIIGLVAMLAIVGVASAQSPCPECDDDGPGNANNSYHGVDVGAVGDDYEALADTDAAYGHTGDEKGFWSWMSICLSAFLDHVERLVGVQTDVDAHAEIYASEEGVDIDASTHGGQKVCDAVGANAVCDYDFDQSDLGDLDGMTWETMSDVESTTGVDVHVPGALLPPDTGDSDTDVCLDAQLELGLCG